MCTVSLYTKLELIAVNKLGKVWFHSTTFLVEFHGCSLRNFKSSKQLFLEGVYRSIFILARVHFGLLRKPYNILHGNIEVKSHAAVFSRPCFRPKWNFTLDILCMISTCEQNFFYAEWCHRKLSDSEFTVLWVIK